MNIPQHETYHALAGAVGLIALDISKEAYEKTQLFFHVDQDGGEVGLMTEDDTTNSKVAPLMAWGPVAAAHDVVALARWHNPTEIRAAGNLSPRDEELIGKYKGNPATPLIVLLATQELVGKLGGNFAKMANLLAKSSNQNLDLMLADVVPFQAASNAFAAGRIKLSQASKR